MRTAETQPALGNLEKTDDLALPQRWRALALLAIAQLLSMSLWFSGAAVLPLIRSEWALSESTAGWLTIAVQLGFVAGTLLSAFLNLPDVLSAKYLVASSAILGAASNAAFGYFAEGPRLGITLRFLTGMFLAGVYPPGMKILATWFRRSRGLALGVLVGALTLGKASSYLINGIGSANWRTNMLVISCLALIGAVVTFLFVENGPFGLPLAPFDWRQVVEVFKNRGVRLA
ncbi:MAG TPA: MFS transporter, partial [Pyrinomonadaceae bacterium]|nr:MFS transporter [Pyrinomonadaceae bacterium]